MASAGDTFKEHPLLIAGLVIGVVLLAYMSSRSATTSTTEYGFSGGGGGGTDPNAAAIEQAAISAGQANLSAIASLVGLESTNGASLTASLAQTSAARDTSLAQTAAAQNVADEQTQAGLDLGKTTDQTLAAIAGIQANTQTSQIVAQQQVANNQTAAQRANVQTQAKQSFWGELFNGIARIFGGNNSGPVGGNGSGPVRTL